jgi:hypothetical protein
VILGFLAKILTGGLLDKLLEAYSLRQQGKISEAEFRSRVEIAAQENAAKIEESWAEASSAAAKATHASLSKSPILQRAWASVLFLQVTVLVWYQIGAPAFQVITGTAWPSPGISLEWAYLLVATQLGAGPLVFRK